jgi:5-methylcytosine-specific restriction endonuclease McrA
MQKHTRVFIKHYNIGEQDIFMCQYCGQRQCVDVHHINGRGKEKDVIENLVGLCRDCHEKVHDGKITKEQLTKLKK